MTSQSVASYQAATLLVHSDLEAQQLLASSEFLSQWTALAGKCPWGTALQSPDFACTWYRCYEDLYRPLILVRYAAGGKMDGLMALAIEKTTGNLRFAGGHQAEYHVWLALPGEQTFIVEALERLRKLGFPSLAFTYLPPATPLQWMGPDWSRKSALRKMQRPLLTVDDAGPVSESLAKKKNRRRLEKLQENGALSFLQLHTPEELDVYYDRIIELYDFRMGAIHGSCPFREDSRKRAFYRALMARHGLLHVTVTKIGDEVIGSHIGIRNKDEVILGIVGHSPFVAIHSPGKLHILQLGMLLHQEGFRNLDLTPGGDAYKEDRATRYEEAYALTIFFRWKALVLNRVTCYVRSSVKRLATALRIKPDALTDSLSAARKIVRNPLRSLASFFKLVRRRIWSSSEVRFYRMAVQDMAAQDVGRISGDSGVHRDSLQDLLCYAPEPRGCSKQDFLSVALAKIDSGAHPYSVIRDHVLVNCGWLTCKIDKSFVTEVGCAYSFPPNSALIWDLYTAPLFREQNLCSTSLKQMLTDAASIAGVEYIYIATFAGNQAARNAIEKIGFQYQNSVFCNVRFGSANYRVV
jgi:CelD/BcsL family acetyltransferase involved in cellulose biosynthesis